MSVVSWIKQSPIKLPDGSIRRIKSNNVGETVTSIVMKDLPSKRFVSITGDVFSCNKPNKILPTVGFNVEKPLKNVVIEARETADGVKSLKIYGADGNIVPGSNIVSGAEQGSLWGSSLITPGV